MIREYNVTEMKDLVGVVLDSSHERAVVLEYDSINGKVLIGNYWYDSARILECFKHIDGSNCGVEEIG